MIGRSTARQCALPAAGATNQDDEVAIQRARQLLRRASETLDAIDAAPTADDMTDLGRAALLIRSAAAVVDQLVDTAMRTGQAPSRSEIDCARSMLRKP